MSESTSNSTNSALSSALLRLMRPLARVMLRHGMAYGDFAELARKAFVDEGLAQLKDTGKRPSISAVSALTGLTRKEAKRLNDLAVLENGNGRQSYNRAVRVVSGWAEDPEFHDATGAPAVLQMDGDGPTFSTLVKKYSGDIPTVAMYTVLESSGTIATTSEGITLRQHAYIPSHTSTANLGILGTDVAELIGTIGHNLQAEPAERHFQRKVSNDSLNPDALDAFREFSSRKSQQLLEEYNHWLSEHELAADGESGTKPCYVAVGIYFSDHTGTTEEL